MELSDFQKKVVESILDGKVKHIDEFFREHCKYWPEKVTGQYSFRKAHTVPDKDGFGYVVMNRDETYSNLQEFLILWQKLEAQNLLVTIPYHKYGLLPVLYEVPNQDKRTLAYDERLLALFLAYNEKAIVPAKELKLFAASNCRTTAELDLEMQRENLRDEVNHRKKSLRWTIAIAIVSILVGVASTLINVLTYTTARTVTITNPHAFADTSKVMLVMPNTVAKEVVPQPKK